MGSWCTHCWWVWVDVWVRIVGSFDKNIRLARSGEHFRLVGLVKILGPSLDSLRPY